MIPVETIDRALAKLDEAKGRYPPPHWQALAEYKLVPSHWLRYTQMQAARLATHASAFDVPIDEPSFVAGQLDGLLMGMAIAREHYEERR